MIGPVSFNSQSMPRPIAVAKRVEQPQPKPEFSADQHVVAEKEKAEPKIISQQEINTYFKNSLERKLDAEHRRLDAQIRTKQATKEWAERIPGQIHDVTKQLSSAGPGEIKDLSDNLASLNSTLITVSNRYAGMVDGWDEFVAEKNANIANYRAQLAAMSGGAL